MACKHVCTVKAKIDFSMLPRQTFLFPLRKFLNYCESRTATEEPMGRHTTQPFTGAQLDCRSPQRLQVSGQLFSHQFQIRNKVTKYFISFEIE